MWKKRKFINRIWTIFGELFFQLKSTANKLEKFNLTMLITNLCQMVRPHDDGSMNYFISPLCVIRVKSIFVINRNINPLESLRAFNRCESVVLSVLLKSTHTHTATQKLPSNEYKYLKKWAHKVNEMEKIENERMYRCRIRARCCCSMCINELIIICHLS